jgi:hypothetical protein
MINNNKHNFFILLLINQLQPTEQPTEQPAEQPAEQPVE